jgi:uncharacterized membrane protein YciS (DUF1049 family)
MTTLLRIFYVALVVALLVAAYQFTGRNTDIVAVHLFRWSSPPQPVWMLLLAAFALGFATAGLLFGIRLLRSSLVARRYRKAVSSLEAEVHQLRNEPLVDDAAALGAGARRG